MPDNNQNKKPTLLIEVREGGKVYVTGPLHDKTLCIAMLEEAKSIVSNWKKPMIHIPSSAELKKIQT